MSKKTMLTAAKDAEKSFEKVTKSQGFSEVEKLAETVGLKKHTDKILEIKNTASESFLQKREIAAETEEDAQKKPWWRRGLKWAIGGGFGLLLGKEFMEGKEKETEIISETVAQGVDIVTDEERLKEINDTVATSMKLEKDLEVVEAEVNKKWNFEPKKKIDNWMEELEIREEKYANYGKMDAIKEAWANTEFEHDKETGEKEKRGLFWRAFAFFPAAISTFKHWKMFEKLKETGAIEKIKKGQLIKEEAEKKIKDAEEKINKGIETKTIAFSAVFAENPGAIEVSKNYLKQLANLTRNADKFSSVERADQIRKIARQSVTKGTAQFGTEFTKMKGFQKYMPGVSIKTRGGFMFVEIIGPALGRALREGAEGGGISRAMGVFWEEVQDVENWKDACPVWGTIRSGERLTREDDNPAWSKWTEFGLSLGMDVAMVAGIVGSLGTLSAPIVAARSAAGNLLRNGLRKGTMKQVAKNSLKASGKFVSKGVSKQSKKRIALSAGGKWALRVNLMMATIGEFFGTEVETIKSEVKKEAYDAMLTDEQKYSLALLKAAKKGELPPEREAILAEEDSKRKKEIKQKEENESAGIFVKNKTTEEKENKGGGVVKKLDFKAKNETKKETQTFKGKIIKMAKEEILKKVA